MNAPAVQHQMWRKSSYSGTTTNCVECASAAWTKSSHSGTNANCVEAASLPAAVALRDSKNPRLGHLTLSGPEWAAFLSSVKRGEI